MLEGEACSDAYECEAGTHCVMQTGTCTLDTELGQSCDPADWQPCAWTMVGPSSAESTWCNPETAVCEANDPFICWQLDYPFPP